MSSHHTVFRARDRTCPCFPKGVHPQEPSLCCATASQGRFQASWTLFKTAIADKCKITTGCSLTLPSQSEFIRFWHYDNDWSLCIHLQSSSGNTEFIHCGEPKQKPPLHSTGWRWWDRRGSPEHKMHLRYIYNWHSFTSSRLGKPYQKILPLKPVNGKNYYLAAKH